MVSVSLHYDLAEQTLVTLQQWQPFTPFDKAEPLPEIHYVSEPDQAGAMLYHTDWLGVCGDQMDNERLRLRNMLEAAMSRSDALATSRQCEDIGDRAEELVQQALANMPAGHPIQNWHHSLGIQWQNVVGLRLLRGVQSGSFSEQLYAVYSHGLIPCGYLGSWPGGHCMAFKER